MAKNRDADRNFKPPCLLMITDPKIINLVRKLMFQTFLMYFISVQYYKRL